MEFSPVWLVGVFAVNLAVGGALVVGVFAAMERRVGVGALGGVGLGTLVVYAQATFGEDVLFVTVAEMKLLVIAAALGAVLGVVGTVLVVEPEL